MDLGWRPETSVACTGTRGSYYFLESLLEGREFSTEAYRALSGTLLVRDPIPAEIAVECSRIQQPTYIQEV